MHITNHRLPGQTSEDFNGLGIRGPEQPPAYLFRRFLPCVFGFHPSFRRAVEGYYSFL